MSTQPSIAIVGGGPGGLALARILHVAGIAATVFERESGPLERPQGGTLDLHEESGLLAIERAGLGAGFKRIARYEDQGTRVLDKSARLLFEDAGSDGNRPEVDRTDLRALLLDSLPARTVRWGAALADLQAGPDSRWHLALTDGHAGSFDLVVGADGAGSRVRPLLSPYRPQYSGLTFVEFGIDDVDARHPALARLVGHGKMEAHGDGMEIIAQRNGHAHIRGYAIFRVPADWAERRFDFSSPAAVRAGLVAEFAGYADAITDLFRAANDSFAVRHICALPVGHRWASRRGLTLIGDAAHLMSPFGGEGVNAAMLDAAELARELIAGEDWAEAVARYERAMFERVMPAAEGSAEGAATLLSHESAALAVAQARSHVLAE
ncbi:FAD-dependent oxidoreductase [Derxia lacustris]|uniref:FAD-dependent oxidoreductase n=1 Tax=Derxia lacustris TaxID=764842 RepID=UPI000A178350|nr:NAD(P)/FAD-dependent oxidoreductase [Derxia lacustris]